MNNKIYPTMVIRSQAEAIEMLEKENQELKKQLENCCCNRTDCTGRIKDSKQYDSLVQRVENQQKEFIDYMEEKIICYENYQNTNLGEYERNLYFDLYNDILEKYKEIIGVSNE